MYVKRQSRNAQRSSRETARANQDCIINAIVEILDILAFWLLGDARMCGWENNVCALYAGLLLLVLLLLLYGLSNHLIAILSPCVTACVCVCVLSVRLMRCCAVHQTVWKYGLGHGP